MGVNCRRRTMPFVGTLAVLALATLRGANAQDTTNATCLSNYSFLYNSKGQSPCLVAAYVAGVCNGGQFNVPALIDGAHYTGPLTSDANNCLCSSIFYCLMSACGLCQNGPVITWTDWTKNCSTVYLTVYPENIPSVTAIPAWAYVNFSVRIFLYIFRFIMSRFLFHGHAALRSISQQDPTTK
ncbi:hypothetical protein BD410DRAFT_301641 [Rickenella mellea]|uniref:Uncharacterized protein n=1 Tax=Rickenella mellea TaxID=50990 RepID=A0A4Y7Q1R8_9AGAM|nr:hypothetical protein BD410DRAFT_301641 [Rickenella mellea]